VVFDDVKPQTVQGDGSGVSPAYCSIPGR